MIEKLAKLYTTLSTISVKGEDSKTMADCLRFIERMVVEEKQKPVATDDVASEDEP